MIVNSTVESFQDKLPASTRKQLADDPWREPGVVTMKKPATLNEDPMR